MRFDHTTRLSHTLFMLLSFLVAMAAFADQTQDIEYWQQVVKKTPDDAEAWFSLGVLYEQGTEGKTDITKAREAYFKSAEMNYAPAMFNMGSTYAKQKDYVTARKWWEKAAEGNVPEAQFNLALLYERGWGGKKDDEKAAYWYQRSAETAMQKQLELAKEAEEKISAYGNFSAGDLSAENMPVQIAAVVTKGQSSPQIFEPESQSAPVVEAVSEPSVVHAATVVEKEVEILAPIEVAQAESSAPEQTVDQAEVSGWGWVYANPELNYTVQLFASKDEDKAKNFIRKYALSDQAKIIPAIVKGVKYHKVIYGNFSEWNDAAAEIGNLPKDLKDQRPWIRKFASLYPELPEGTDTSARMVAESSQPVAEPAAPEPVVQEAVKAEVAKDVAQAEQPAQEAAVVDEQAEAKQSDSVAMVQTDDETVIDTTASKTEPAPEAEPESAEMAIETDAIFTDYARLQLAAVSLGEDNRQQLLNGLEAVKAKNYAEAFAVLNPLAETGLPEAQYRVALLHAEGKGVEQNTETGHSMMKLAAEQGHPYAQQQLAEYYAKGIGVEANSGLAEYWQQTASDNIKKLAELNNAQ